MGIRYFDHPHLVFIKHKKYVFWDDKKRKYRVDLRDDDEDANPDPDKQYSYTHLGSIKTWDNSKEKGRHTLMKKILEDELTKLSQYEGKPEYAAELKKQQKFKPALWIQTGEDGTCYVDLENVDLVPTTSVDNVASEDEIKKWEEASLKKKTVIVDGVLKALKRRREVREAVKKNRANKKSTKKKKSAAAASAASTAPVAAAVSSSSTTQSSEPNVTHNHHHHHHHHHHNTTNINTQGNGKVNINV